MFQLTAASFKNTINKRSSGIILSALLVIVNSPLLTVAHATNKVENISVSRLHPSAVTCDTVFSDISANFSKTKRPTIKQNSQRIEYLLTQLNHYQNTAHTPRQRYFIYKAQAWLNYATHENSIKSDTNAGIHALQAAADIVNALYQSHEQQLPLTTDIPVTSALMRPDLWATLSALKNSQGIDIAPRELAFSEVALIWAAADQCEHGERQSGAHFRMSERWLEQAREAYIHTHDSENNVKLEALANDYFKQYSLLDTESDICRGQKMSTHTLSAVPNPLSASSQALPIILPIPTVTYRIIY